MMIRKLGFALFIAVAVVGTAGAAMAQTGELRGHVMMKQADGTTKPVEGAQVDIYRVDIVGKTQVKSRKDGTFVHAGLMFTGTYLLSVSAPGATPKAQGNIRPGHGQDYEFILDPGDGHVMTEADAKVAANGAASTEGETAEQRAAREADAAKLARLTAERDKAVNSNAIVTGSFTEGNKLLVAGRAIQSKDFAGAIVQFDQAIAKYDEGLAADPDHPGAPALLTQKSLALTDRARAHFNAGVTATTPADKTAQAAAAKTDIMGSIEAGKKALEIYKAAPADVTSGPNYQNNLRAALEAVMLAYKFGVPNVDPGLVADGAKAFDDFIEATPDQAKKDALKGDRAKMLFDGGDFAGAVTDYQKLLTTSPDNLDYMYWLGLALISVDANDKAKIQEGVNQLQAFVDKAPATDNRREEVKGIVDEMKRSQNVTPQKPTRRRGN